MRGQLSFEFMLYTAISLLAVVGTLALYLKGRAVLANSISAPMLGEFEAAAGYGVSSSSGFYAFVPPGICSNGERGNATGAIAALAGEGQVMIANSICGAEGRLAMIDVTREGNGSYLLGGG